MTFLRIEHVQLMVPPGEQARQQATDFYVGLLGLEEVSPPTSIAARGGRWLRSGDVEVHLGVEEAFVPALRAHGSFVVERIGGLVVRLQAAGVEVRWVEEVPGPPRCHVFDPFGNRIELVGTAAN